MQFRGTYDWTDFRHAQLLHAQKSLGARLLYYATYPIVGLVLVWGFWWNILGQFPFNLMLVLLVLIVFMDLYSFFFLPRKFKRIFQQTKELNLPMEFEITEEGLTITNMLGSLLRPWKNFLKWKEDKAMLMLYLSDVSFVMLPKRFFTDTQQIEGIKRYLDQNQIPTARDRNLWKSSLVILLLTILVTWAIFAFMSGRGS